MEKNVELGVTPANPPEAEAITKKEENVVTTTTIESQDSEHRSSDIEDDDDNGFANVQAPVESAKDLVTTVIHTDDDPTLSPYTFRLFFLGSGLSIFGSVLSEIFYFKPQVIFVSVIFLTVISYILGEAMAFIIPRKGFLRYLNPGPFNIKEHAAITIMASAASQTAAATEVLAAQELFYGGYPSKAAGIFVTIASQMLGFGVAGLLREVLVYPTRMIWPINLPTATLLETFHRDADKTGNWKRLKVFGIIFVCMFVWEAFPQYIFTVFTGISIFCLADQHNLIFTFLFGGSTANEGLGFLNLSLDWNYIAGLWGPLWMPLQTSVNLFIGINLCYVLFMAIYYGNLWESQQFPFMSQLLFNSTASNSTYYVPYNQTLVLNQNLEIDTVLLDEEGTPWLPGTFIGYLITSNMALTAGIVHMFLWNWQDISKGFAFLHPKQLKRVFIKETWMFWNNIETPEERLARLINDPDLDPHYKTLLKGKYPECPNFWWFIVLAASWIMGIVCLYVMHSTLPWWGYIVATLVLFVWVLFFASLMGLTGFQINTQPIAQVIGGYLFPGKPLANMYFTCFTYNALQQAQTLGKDMKLAQYAKLAPRCTFIVQVAGCLIGALFNWVMMVTIVDNQSTVLTSIQGSNVWSGQSVQTFNTLGISFSMASDLFSVGQRYEWVTLAFLLGFLAPIPLWLAHRATGWRVFSYLNTSIILWYMGNLYTGINSGYITYFMIAAWSQFFLRRYRPKFFVKWNYLASAALDGGAQVLIFIFTFAVQGGSGHQVVFPYWPGAPDQSITNPDRCMINTANFAAS